MPSPSTDSSTCNQHAQGPVHSAGVSSAEVIHVIDEMIEPVNRLSLLPSVLQGPGLIVRREKPISEAPE